MAGASVLDRPQDRPELPIRRQARNGRSPLPHLGVAAGACLVALAVFRSIRDGGPSGDGPPLDLYRSVVGPFLGGEGEVTPWTGDDTWLALGALVVAAVAVTVWVRRVGMNARPAGQFGAIVVLAAVPAWYVLPASLGVDPSGLVDTREEFISRLGLALVVLLGQAVFLRLVLVAKLWQAGRLPGVRSAGLLIVPVTATTAWFLGSTLYTVIAIGSDGTGHSGWLPTERMVDAMTVTQRGTALAFFLLVAYVSYVQHVGLAADRRDEAVYRASRL